MIFQNLVGVKKDIYYFSEKSLAFMVLGLGKQIIFQDTE